MYLFYFVRLKSKETANKRHGGIDFNKLMITITYTYTCLLFFTFSYFVEGIPHFIFPRVDPLMGKHMQFWGKILVYSNSFANTYINLYNNRRE